jgi:hypothetical protein
MDCYALGMEAAADAGEGPGLKPAQELVRLMVEGMVEPWSGGEKALYRLAARLCGKCAETNGKPARAALFRVYEAVFKEMSGGKT